MSELERIREILNNNDIAIAIALAGKEIAEAITDVASGLTQISISLDHIREEQSRLANAAEREVYK